MTKPEALRDLLSSDRVTLTLAEYRWCSVGWLVAGAIIGLTIASVIQAVLS